MQVEQRTRYALVQIIIDGGTGPAQRAGQILSYPRLPTLLGSVVQQVPRVARPGGIRWCIKQLPRRI